MPFLINGRKVGSGYKPYFVAEMSGNHCNNLDKALSIIDAAKEAGADAIKLQTYKASTITIDHNSEEFYLKEGLWKNKRLFDLYKEASTPWEWHEKLFEHANNIGITIFSSPFDFTSVDFLEKLSPPVYKIASPEIVDLPLIKKVCETKKPIIISTGASSISEINDAVKTIKINGSNEIMLLHCTSAYPAPINEANLSTIQFLKSKFDAEIGLSDHTVGIVAAVTSISLGASLIEKHFTLSKDDGGIDNAFSLDPKEFAKMVSVSLDVYSAIGNPKIDSTKSESNVKKNRRSLYVVKDIKKGETFTEENIKSIRPANGISPKFYYQIIGKKATKNLFYGDALINNMIENFEFTYFLEEKDKKEDLKLVAVNPDNKIHCESLYKFLERRNFFISHDNMPNYEKHIKFVKNNPYREWFLILHKENYIGSVYVLNDNGIGLDLNQSDYKFASDTFKILFSQIKPLESIPSIRNNKFHININPQNKELQNTLKKLGFYVTQKTFAIE